MYFDESKVLDNLEEVNPLNINRYVILQSPRDSFLYSVVAQDTNGEYLLTVAAEVPYHEAVEILRTVNLKNLS